MHEETTIVTLIIMQHDLFCCSLQELYGDRTPEEQQRQAEAWRRFSSTLRSKGAVFGRHMLRHCQKDLSRAIEAKPVPVIPPAIEEGAQNGPSSPAASGGGKKKHAKAEVAEAPTEALPYPLFAYSADSLCNPVITPHTCCQCPGNCRTNPECACRNRYPGQVPLQPGTERLSDNQLGSTVSLTTHFDVHSTIPKCVPRAKHGLMLLDRR